MSAAKTYFDTSALVVAFVEEEEHHEAALRELSETQHGITVSHSIAEVFSTLTGGRLPVRVSPEEAIELLHDNLIGRLEIIELLASDYQSVLEETRKLGVRGGAVYDLLHLQAARKAGAERILTINISHFQSFAPDLKALVALP